jgi:hypothetical protein
MIATAIVDLRKGKVYRVPCKTLKEARTLARSRYYRPSRIVVESATVIECYENGELVAKEAMNRLAAPNWIAADSHKPAL